MKKSKIVFGLVAVLFLTAVLPMAASANVTDVPTDHWAYHAVNSAVTRGYLTVFEDGTFQGTRAVDRYALANVINRLLEDIEVSRVRGTSGDLLEASDLRLRFEEDLATWYADQQSLRDDVKKVDENALVAEERVTRVVSAQVALEDQVTDIRNNTVALQNGLAEVQAGVVSVQLAMDDQRVGVTENVGRLAENEERIAENELRMAELIGAVVQLEKELLLQAEAINGLENWAGEKGAVFASLQASDSQVTSELEALRLTNQQLEKDLQNVAVLLQRETQNRADLAAELEQARADIIVLREDTSGLDVVKTELATDVNAQINAALIREQRLERQIKTLEEDFSEYRLTADENVKSAKTLATVGIALGAIGAIIGAIAMFGN
ncbi:MAG: S-layer homology domain-containing protein [Limnochordia bacterium]|nr:S-layer homology domain-containing protein [Limnochordia bacterium]